MPLNKSKGNMYDFVNYTWNTCKGQCPHFCSYCYCRRWGKQPELHFDDRELKTDLGIGNFIFVGSSCDMFSDAIETIWILRTLEHCCKFDNRYLFQTKNPSRFYTCIDILPKKSIACTTIETNRFYKDIMVNSPHPVERSLWMGVLSKYISAYVTIEPIIDFDLEELVELIEQCNPRQVNIGADSGNNGLPEPSEDKILTLIAELEKFTKVKQKKNLARLLK